MTRVTNSTGNRARADLKKPESAHQQVLICRPGQHTCKKCSIFKIPKFFEKPVVFRIVSTIKTALPLLPLKLNSWGVADLTFKKV
jgi:hypothetical protein